MAVLVVILLSVLAAVLVAVLEVDTAPVGGSKTDSLTGGSSSRGEAAGRATAPAAASPRPVVEEEALEAYTAMLRAFGRAQRNPDVRIRTLTDTADGQALTYLTRIVSTTRQRGLRASGVSRSLSPTVTLRPPSSTSTSTSTRPVGTDAGSARILDCLDTSRAPLVRADPAGPSYRDTPGGRRAVAALLQWVGGSWKVTQLRVAAVGTC